MSDSTHIEWTDATWNPVTGCSVVSPGCTNCYAMRLAGTRLKHIPSRKGLTIDTKAGPVWNGEVRFNREWLDPPLKWKRPRMIFVCAHGDLFHESVPNEWIDHIFAVMALCPQHTFQVLTKRSKRMREYMDKACGRIADAVMALRRQHGIERGNACAPLPHVTPGRAWWPLANVWLGVSVEDQTRADARIPDLLATPAAVRFISAEPLLGPVDLTKINWIGGRRLDVLHSYTSVPLATPGFWAHEPNEFPHLDWVIVGGESGKGARPMHPDWARQLRDQCAAADVPFFFKQWGTWADQTNVFPVTGSEDYVFMADRKVLGAGAFGQGMVDHDWREQGAAWMSKIGKARAGRLLDGIEHNGMPEALR